MSLGGLAKVYNDIQNIRIALQNKTWASEHSNGRAVPRIYEDMIEQLKQMEKTLVKEAKQYLKHYPVWNTWLKHIKGLGPTLAAQLLGMIEDIRRFDNPSKLWKYCGLAVSNSRKAEVIIGDIMFVSKYTGSYGNRFKVQLKRSKFNDPEVKVKEDTVIVYLAKNTTQQEVVDLINSEQSLSMPVYCDLLGNGLKPAEPSELYQLEGGQDGHADRPQKGQKLGYNPRLKALLYNIGTSFIKTKSPYREIYDQTKARYEQARPDWSRNRIHLAAMRKMEKVFLANLWEAWREAEGLPVRIQEYPFDYLRHSPQDRYTPEYFLAKSRGMGKSKPRK